MSLSSVRTSAFVAVGARDPGCHCCVGRLVPSDSRRETSAKHGDTEPLDVSSFMDTQEKQMCRMLFSPRPPQTCFLSIVFHLIP